MNSLKSLLYCLSIFLVLVACENKSSDSSLNEEAAAQTESPSNEVSESNSSLLANPNLATKEELMELMDESMVNQIIDVRPFLNMQDLDQLVSTTLDSVQKEELYSKIFVPMNLNTTPEDDFKIIPGVGNRMAHEFEEYRPYTKIQQFRKEIGKYVDENEVARLEQYIFVPVELNTATEEDILALPGVGKRMAHEFEEYRPYQNMDQFRKEIGKYVDDKELARLERFVYISEQ